MKMLSLLIVIPIIALCGCGSGHSNPSENPNYLSKWVKDYKSSVESNQYSENSFIRNNQGNVKQGIPTWNLTDQRNSPRIGGASTLFSAKAKSNRNIFYDVNQLTYEDGTLAKQLLIHVSKADTTVRAFEYNFLNVDSSSKVDSPSLNKARQKWISLCNAHQVDSLVNQLYSENAIYFNHRPLVIGRKAFIQEYSYMADTNYALTLSPLHLEPINENQVVEIGQCSGTYKAKYVLVWHKDKDGTWRIIFDSNV